MTFTDFESRDTIFVPQFAFGALGISAASATAVPAGLVALAASSAVAALAAEKVNLTRCQEHEARAFACRLAKESSLIISNNRVQR
jgi:hypothetical protein